MYTGNANFSVGDFVLKWDKSHEDKGKHTKFHSLWIGPYIVHEKLGPHMYHLQSLDGRIDNLPINDQDINTTFNRSGHAPCHVYSLPTACCFHFSCLACYFCFCLLILQGFFLAG